MSVLIMCGNFSITLRFRTFEPIENLPHNLWTFRDMMVFLLVFKEWFFHANMLLSLEQLLHFAHIRSGFKQVFMTGGKLNECTYYVW